MLIRAYAKINLTLDVLSRRPDGYHEVDMIMQSVDLYDELTIEYASDLSLSVVGDAPATPDNLVLRAANLLRAHTGCNKGARLHLVKHTPTAAGLGGGSADAAAALRGLNELWGLNCSLEELCRLGGQLGADIPFCLVGGTMRATGIGTTLSPLPSPQPMGVLIVKPCEGMLTRDVYRSLRLPPQGRPDTQAAIDALYAGNARALCASLGNVLESVTLPARPQAQRAMAAMQALGAQAVRMSGSGPSVFGLFTTQELAQSAAEQLDKEFGFRAAVSFHQPV